MPLTRSPISASSSTRGKIIKITATSSPGTLLHTVSTVSTDFDYVSIWAWNVDTVNRTLTLEFGGTTADDRIPYIVEPGKPPICLVDRWDLQGNSSADVIRAYATSANQILVKLVVYRVGTA
jgi:hypothetical protein